MRAALQALAWIARGEQQGRARRSLAVLGEMAELGEDAISEHDRIGRLAVRLDVSRLVVVGTGRSERHAPRRGHGGLVGGEGRHRRRRRRRLALLRAELRPGDVVLVKASSAAGLGALADALVADSPDGVHP